VNKFGFLLCNSFSKFVGIGLKKQHNTFIIKLFALKSKKEILQTRVNELEETVKKLQQSVTKERWLDAHDVKRRLNISDSTLWRYRKENKIPYSKFGNKILYPESFFTKSLKNKIVNSHLL
jgi:hypothetical protein